MIKEKKIIVKKLTPSLLNDFLDFFDHEAFADNPDWSFCYCYFHHFPHDQKVWKNSLSDENRDAVCDLIIKGQMNGYLAYINNKTVGWCNAGPRTNMTTLPEYPEPDEDQIGSVVCFVVSKSFRKQGVARLLLSSVINGFETQRYKFVEGYPLKEARSEKDNHFGPLSLFLSAGFEPYREGERVIVVRKSLI